MDEQLQENSPRLLLIALKDEYGAKTQDMILAAPGNWESLHIKASHPRTQFMQLYRMAFDEAVEFGGMGMNSVAKTYFLFKKLGTSQAERKELLLKVNGDMTQFVTSLASDEEGRAYESPTTRMSTTLYAGGDYEYDNEDWQYHKCEDDGVYWQDESWCDYGDYGAEVWHDTADWSEQTNWADTDAW